jgi:hypothetical protein
VKAFEHLSDERIQAFLDAELSQEEMARVQAHAASCSRCESEIDAWRLLFEELEELPTLEPSVHLVDHVMGALPERAPIGLRLPEWIKEDRTISQTEHLVAARLQDYIDGALTRDGRVRADAHLAGCISCRDELSGWSQLFSSLGDVSELAPSHDFAERIMQRVRVHAPVPAASDALTVRARRWVSGWSLAAARGMVPAQLARLAPRSRRAWAVVASLAAAPTIAAAGVIFMIFSHPLLTPGYLASFLWWKASAATGAVGSWIAAASVQASEGVLETGLVQALTASAGGLVMTGVGLSALMAASLWVVYRNLFIPSITDRYARISL